MQRRRMRWKECGCWLATVSRMQIMERCTLGRIPETGALYED